MFLTSLIQSVKSWFIQFKNGRWEGSKQVPVQLWCLRYWNGRVFLLFAPYRIQFHDCLSISDLTLEHGGPNQSPVHLQNHFILKKWCFWPQFPNCRLTLSQRTRGFVYIFVYVFGYAGICVISLDPLEFCAMHFRSNFHFPFPWYWKTVSLPL